MDLHIIHFELENKENFEPNPDSNFSLHQTCRKLALQICKLAVRLIRQECKLETSLQKRRSHHATNLQQVCDVKLIANIAKTEYRKNLGIELATYRFQSRRFNQPDKF
ncbi:hypothetical protein AVEN_12516-1 [Araneus ventricosus]|uniref:Uncharacterized protein n=1 Tax=Araneus ventricosus TaxID=182803 RepID=A0A4Y2IM10_ARAVE|nr:hypothetical protein AVEN_12516-1 [Araneus ventricosus]